ncbi:putative JmjC domain-containing histone demethylation protein 2B [Trichinella spiralis]|uniref:putative JmjC domain-containing histone demethylation protein 2B n=1 Tax=Trichinella spiralis TaxID=6334 RepID=UPI0001EFD4DF|nr:putative JmjC domain-containing histone demethylation protein 2B [Trichinella spiralis]
MMKDCAQKRKRCFQCAPYCSVCFVAQIDALLSNPSTVDTDSRRPFRSAVILSDILVSNVYYYSFLCQLVGQVTSSNGMTSDFSACRQGGVRTPLSFRHAMDTCVRCGRPATVVASLKQLNCAHLICAGCAHVRGLGACPLCMPLKEGSYEMLACRLSNSTTSADASGRSSVVSQQQQQQQQQLFNNDQLCPATSSPAVSRFYAPVQDTSLPPACTADSHSGSFLPTTTITTTSAVPQTQFSGYRIPTALPRPNCSGCMGGVRAIAKCEDCQEFLCADCANCHHRTVGVKPHRILDLFSNSVHNYNSSDFNYHTNSQQQQQQCALTRMSQLSLCNGMNDHGISLCNVHLTDYTHIFCDGCLTFICPKCAVDHHGHGLRTTGGSLISPANEMDVKNTRRLLNSGHMHLKLVTDSLDSVNRMGNRLESRVTGLVKDIQTISQTLINALEERRLKWLEQLQSWRVLRMGKLSMCEEHLRHYRDRIQIAVAKLENLGSLNTADSDLWHHELEECIRTFPYELMPHEDDNLAFLSPKPFILMTIQQAGGLKTNASPIHSVVYGENGRQCVKGIEKPEGCDNVNETGERYLYVYICVYMDVRMLYMYILKLEIGQREDCMSTAVVTDKQLFVPGTRTCRCESRFTRFPLRKLSLLRIRSPLQGKFELSFINFTMRPSFKSTIKEDLGAIEEGCKCHVHGGDDRLFQSTAARGRGFGQRGGSTAERCFRVHAGCGPQRRQVSLFVRGQAMPNCPLKLSVNGGRSYLTVSGRYPTNRFCSQGSGDGQLYRPWGIACDKLNRIIVADRLPGRSVRPTGGCGGDQLQRHRRCRQGQPPGASVHIERSVQAEIRRKGPRRRPVQLSLGRGRLARRHHRRLRHSQPPRSTVHRQRPVLAQVRIRAGIVLQAVRLAPGCGVRSGRASALLHRLQQPPSGRVRLGRRPGDHARCRRRRRGSFPSSARNRRRHPGQFVRCRQSQQSDSNFLASDELHRFNRLRSRHQYRQRHRQPAPPRSAVHGHAHRRLRLTGRQGLRGRLWKQSYTSILISLYFLSLTTVSTLLPSSIGNFSFIISTGATFIFPHTHHMHIQKCTFDMQR